MNHSQPYYQNYARRQTTMQRTTRVAVRSVNQSAKLLGSLNQFSLFFGATTLLFILTR